MGAETCFVKNAITYYPCDSVKLNNPQMGAETENTSVYMNGCLYVVKLNNPQMGAETKYKRYRNDLYRQWLLN